MPRYLVTLSRWSKFTTSIEIEARTKDAALDRARDPKFQEDASVDEAWENVDSSRVKLCGCHRIRPGGEIRKGR